MKKTAWFCQIVRVKGKTFSKEKSKTWEEEFFRKWREKVRKRNGYFFRKDVRKKKKVKEKRR